MNIRLMQTNDIPCAIALWKKQFVQYCHGDSFPPFHNGGEAALETYLREQIGCGQAIAAFENHAIAGYMAWMTFDFHNERTAFLPIVGHAASLCDEMRIYAALYAYTSRVWVRDNCFNHLWMTYYDDETVQNGLYALGFGSYVVDACQSTSVNLSDASCAYCIERATAQDADALLAIADDSRRYYADAPIFLQRSKQNKQDIEVLLNNAVVLVARDGNAVIGVMSFTLHCDFDTEQLTTTDSAYIGDLGAFVDSRYRGKGIGKALLTHAFRICNENGKSHLHVCFESANPFAASFWPRFFKPAIRSVRRTINKDANSID